MPEGGTKKAPAKKKPAAKKAVRKSAKKPAAKSVVGRQSSPAKSATKRAPTNPAVRNQVSKQPASRQPYLFGLDYLTVFILLGGLALAALNLVIIVQSTGRVSGLEQAQNQLLSNYSRSVEKQSELAAFQKKLQETPPPTPDPVVLWSVVEFSDQGEQMAITANLVKPLLDWHLAVGPRPEALLVERRFATSENVSLRLFFEDGSEQSFLWPEEGAAADTLWLPPCGPNSPEGLERPVACPTQFLLDYPKITDTLLRMGAE
jgi:hypothetical protein